MIYICAACLFFPKEAGMQILFAFLSVSQYMDSYIYLDIGVHG